MRISNSSSPYKSISETLKPTQLKTSENQENDREISEENQSTPDPEHQQTAKFVEDYKAKPKPSIGKVEGSNLDSPMSRNNQEPYQKKSQESKKRRSDPDTSPSNGMRNLVELDPDPLIGYMLVFSEEGQIPKMPEQCYRLSITIEDWEAGRKDELVSSFLDKRELKLFSEQPIHLNDQRRLESFGKTLEKFDDLDRLLEFLS